MNKIVIFIFLVITTLPVIADTYPVVPGYEGAGFIWHQSLNSACASHNSGSNYYVASMTSITLCDTKNSSGQYTGYNTMYKPIINSCPNGGTVSGSNCINAPACISPQIRKQISPYSCFTPVECVYPESDNGSGICANNTCPTGQTRNPTTNQCRVSPTCGATETLNLYSNLCELKKLTCPVNSHANTANDTCLKNAPLACPTGQHDDGTYKCVANDALGCTSAQQPGYINGVPQCIPKTNAEQLAANAVAAAAIAAIKKLEADIAASNLLADPTNTTKQAANTSAQDALNAANATASQEQKNQDSGTLRSIDQSLKAREAAELGKTAGGGGQSCSEPPTCSGDAIQCSILLESFKSSCQGDSATQAMANQAMHGTTGDFSETAGDSITATSFDSSGLGLGSSCPAPRSYAVMQSSMTIDLSAFCTIAGYIGHLVLLTSYFISARIIAA